MRNNIIQLKKVIQFSIEFQSSHETISSYAYQFSDSPTDFSNINRCLLAYYEQGN